MGDGLYLQRRRRRETKMHSELKALRTKSRATVADYLASRAKEQDAKIAAMASALAAYESRIVTLESRGLGALIRRAFGRQG